MTPLSVTDRLTDIRDAASDVMAFVRGMDAAAFAALPETDRKTYRAVKNAVVEIGEAVKSLPQDLRERHPNIDWKGFAGVRDVMVHQYFALDLERLWPVVSEELAPLLAAVQAELARRP